MDFEIFLITKYYKLLNIESIKDIIDLILKSWLANVKG